MDHVAIMKKSWRLIPKILAGEKVIESRWYKNKSAPWGKIKIGDMIYFKNTGEPVRVMARVKKIIGFANLNSDKVRQILNKYGKKDGIDDIDKYFELFKEKKYCLLIFLEKPEIIRPFEINKNGFGAMAAWISVTNVNLVKRV